MLVSVLERPEARATSVGRYSRHPLASLPREFMVPHMPLRKAWQYWTRGNESTYHRPWRYILPAEVGDKESLNWLKRIRKIMLAAQEALPEGTWKDTATFQEYDAMFDAVRASFEFPKGTGLDKGTLYIAGISSSV